MVNMIYLTMELIGMTGRLCWCHFRIGCHNRGHHATQMASSLLLSTHYSVSRKYVHSNSDYTTDAQRLLGPLVL